MIDAPASRTWSGVSPLTAAWVPTGMKTGVSTGPCGVSRRPRRAGPSVESRVKRQDMGKCGTRNAEQVDVPHSAFRVPRSDGSVAPQLQAEGGQFLLHLVERGD